MVGEDAEEENMDEEKDIFEDWMEEETDEPDDAEEEQDNEGQDESEEEGAETEEEKSEEQAGSKEADLLAEIARLTREKNTADEALSKYRSAAKQYGYEGEDDDVLAHMLADSKGMSIDELKKEQEAAKAAREADPEYREFMDWRAQRENEAVFAADMAAIRAAYPSEQAKSVQEIPNFEKFAELRSRDVGAVDAYRIANFDAVSAHARAAAKAQAMREGKEHMQKIGGGGGTADAEIPAHVLADYKAYGYSEKEAVADYKKYIKMKSR